jgi:glutamate carboxypeptidase
MRRRGPLSYAEELDPILTYLAAQERAITALLRQFVECESPSDDPAAVNRFVELVSDTVAPMSRVKTHAGGKFGTHLVCEMQLPGRKKNGQVLALGHSDTVWPMGTLRTMPFREAEGRLWGPGVLDMKAGIAFFIFAVRALR